MNTQTLDELERLNETASTDAEYIRLSNKLQRHASELFAIAHWSILAKEALDYIEAKAGKVNSRAIYHKARWTVAKAPKEL